MHPPEEGTPRKEVGHHHGDREEVDDARREVRLVQQRIAADEEEYANVPAREAVQGTCDGRKGGSEGRCTGTFFVVFVSA